MLKNDANMDFRMDIDIVMDTCMNVNNIILFIIKK
jgi:hypothetical protein